MIDIIPAIDIKNGKCVRLYQGDFAKETIYADDPIAIAKQFASEGAQQLHLVDLDAAQNPLHSQQDLIAKIALATNLKIQVGGGIRDQKNIAALFDAGISRVVIGSMAVKNPTEVKKWLQIFGSERIVLAFDVSLKNGVPYLVTNGWQEQSIKSLWEILNEYERVKYILCTDIARDGVLSGPNFCLYRELRKKYPKLFIQASGGVSELYDIKQLNKDAIDAVIVGKALYEKRFSLREALPC